jgi:methyl-accepting chemotaxis protein
MVHNLRSSLDSVQAKESEASTQAKAAQNAAQAAEEALKKADQAAQEITKAAAQVENAAQEVKANAGDISETTGGMRAGAEMQKDHIHEILGAMERLSSNASEIAASAANAANKSEEARREVENGAQIAERTGGAMQQLRDVAGHLKENTTKLGAQSEGIGHIMSVINDIADQTNLLALNAAIEAARAGEAGRGFAVVADEVRKLAEKTMDATQEVHSSIQSIQNLVHMNSSGMDNAVDAIGNVSRLATETTNSLEHVLELVREGASQMMLIAQAVDGQSSSSANVTTLVNNVSSVVEHNGELIAAADSRVQSLLHKAGELLALVTALRK